MIAEIYGQPTDDGLGRNGISETFWPINLHQSSNFCCAGRGEELTIKRLNGQGYCCSEHRVECIRFYVRFGGVDVDCRDGVATKKDWHMHMGYGHDKWTLHNNNNNNINLKHLHNTQCAISTGGLSSSYTNVSLSFTQYLDLAVDVLFLFFCNPPSL